MREEVFGTGEIIIPGVMIMVSVVVFLTHQGICLIPEPILTMHQPISIMMDMVGKWTFGKSCMNI